MRSFLRLVIQNPIATVLVVVAMGFGGVYSVLHMPVDLFPNLEVPVVNIITHYPAAAPEDIELLVTRPIEDEMRSIPGVKRVASTSAQGVSQVTVEFIWGTTVRDARQLVQARLGRLAGILPSGVAPWLESVATRLQEVCGYIIYGAGDPITVHNIVRHDFSGRLLGVEGVSSVEVQGGEQRAFYVVVRPESLAPLNLSVRDIASIVKEHNLAVVAGFLDRSAREYLIRGDARIKSLDDIRSIPVVKGGERTVLLGSVAKVYEGRAPRRYVVHGDGVPAVAVIVRKQPGASAIRVVTDVDQAMSELRKLLPAGTRMKKFYDQSEIILEARNEILRDLGIGACLVVLILYFFLGTWRPTFIVAVTIPITFLATVALMHWMGLSLNIITMTALALVIGMIVDDAIVVAENIHRYVYLTPDPGEASIQGAADIAGPDASGTFTTVAAFLPMLILGGIAAIFLRPFGFTISAALLISLLVSLSLVPMLFSRGRGIISYRDDFLGLCVLRRLDRLLQSTLVFSFRHRGPTLVLFVLFFGLAGLAAFLGKSSFLPPIDEGALLIEYVMPHGTSIKESNRIGDALDRIALADLDVSCVYRRTGSPKSSYLMEGVNRGELMIKLKPKSIRRRSVSQIMAALKSPYSAFRGVAFLYHQPTQEKIDESFSGLPAFFGVTIYGADMDTLISLALQIEKELIKDPAVGNVVNNTKVRASQVDVRVDYPKLAQYGVAQPDVLATLQAAGFGIESTRILRQKEEIPILVKMDTNGPLGLDRFKDLPIVGRDGGTVPLARVADVRVSHAPAAITRLNGQRQITLVAEVEGNIPALVSRLRERFKAVKLPKGYSLDFTGQYKLLIKMAIEMAFTILAAIVLIYLILAMQFRSWLQPLIMLLTIPFSLVGALIALFVTGQGVDISVGMGAVTLVGIAVNNAIVLIDYANKQIALGKGGHDAALSAASVRLRPILLTSFTTISALIPAAIGTTVGSKIFQPFAITVIGGLLSGIVVTLVLVPTLVMVGSHRTPVEDAGSGGKESRP